ncbi:dolichol kinase EVAN isoform X2 [Punica granatum]|uniref:dolichol kinase n=3 Tax=Punica granatum TaxID=22663 RepID=A0A6P8CX90_PUNGR|nr:dolichol kinase EVAN isoform X1 [Punica granatum]XP_031386615.1 dolichol kinase EVAN isoform X2 [Punica granatum]
MASLWNGERAVVLLFVSRVVFSLPLSLLSHGIVLIVLSLAAFYVEIRLESSPPIPQFKTRPGASSGMLLGAATLPTVLISKLIQMSRALSLKRIRPEEIDYIKMQYWAACVSCFSVLIFFHLVLWRSSRSPHSLSLWGVKFAPSCLSLCSTCSYLSLAAICYYGLQPTFMPFWVLSHGFAAVKLIQHLLHTFPSCASIGEALLVTAGLVLYFGDMLTCTFVKVNEKLTSMDITASGFGNGRSEISIVIQGVLLGLLVFPLLFNVLVRIWDQLSSNPLSGSRARNEFSKSILFFTSLGFILTIIIPSWMQFVQDFNLHPLLWVISFVFQDPLKRLSLCMYWAALIYASVSRFYHISKDSTVERILLRKYYHLMAVSMFSPALILQPEFLDLAFGGAVAVFLVLEIIRVWKIWPLGQPVHQFMNAFTDHRDSDLLIISHFSLLLGCALPIWMSSGYNDRPLAPFAGILSLGIGDTMASMVGHKYGVLRWSKTGKKTIEGTAAGITSVLVACSVLLPVLTSSGYILSQHWSSLVLAVVASGLLEAYTAQLDNAFIPLVFYSLLCL